MNELMTLAKRTDKGLDVSLFYRQSDGNYNYVMPDGSYRQVLPYTSDHPVFISLTPQDILNWRKHG